jgi:hypothetical protein
MLSFYTGNSTLPLGSIEMTTISATAPVSGSMTGLYVLTKNRDSSL